MTGDRARADRGPAGGDEGDIAGDEGLLSSIAGATDAGLLAVDDGTVAFANAAAGRFLGRPADALIGRDAAEALPEGVATAVDRFAADSDATERTVPWPQAGDTSRDAPQSATLRRAAGENRIVVTIHPAPADPTEEQAEPSSAEATAPRVDSVADVAVLRLDVDRRIEAWSDGAAALTGWSPSEVVGTHVAVLYPEDAPDPDQVLSAARREGRGETAGWRLRSDGSQFWASVTVTPRRDDGTVIGYEMVLRDRTERKRAEDERELLAEVSAAVAEAETFADGVETALAAVCERTQWAYGEAWTPADDGDHLRQFVAHAEDPTLEPFLAASRDVTFRFGEGLPGRVWESESPSWIPDASAEPREVFHRTDLADEVGLQAAFGVPIVTDDGVVAVLTFFLRERRRADDELVEVVTDIAADLGGLMARKRAQDTLARERSLLRRVFEASPVGLLVTDADGVVTRANRQAARIFDGTDGDLAGTPFPRLAATFRDANGDPVAAGDLPVARALASGEAVTGVELELAGEESTWASVSVVPLEPTDGTAERAVVVAEDVTERKEREQSLRAFRKAVEQAGHSIYVTDRDGTIEYVNPMFERTTGYSAEEAVGETPRLLSSGEHDESFFDELWATILDGEVWQGEVTNRRKSGENYVVNQTIAPIVDDSGAIERFVAINDDVTEQKRREQTLRRQRNSLERIKQIMESLRPINRELARAGTRGDIDRLVCERLAASEAYLFAWIGEYNSATGEITPREWAGVDDGFVDDLDLRASGDGDSLAARTVAEPSVNAIREVPTDPTLRDRRDRALEYGYQSQALVPVVYGETVFGVIGVYSARPDAFDEYERGLLRELGERIGHAINAAENKQLLHTDTVVELEFEIRGDGSPLAAVTADLDCRLSLNDVTPASGSAYVCYLEVDGAPPAAVRDALERRSTVESARVVEAHGDTGVLEVTGPLGPIATLVEYGATVRSFDAADGKATVVAETAPQSDVEAIITDVEGSHDGSLFVAKRTLDREVKTLTLIQSAVEEALTDRQREALALAYHAGYFASPRSSTGEELADVLGISSPTFYRHVREAVRKSVGLVLDTDDERI